MMKYYFRLEDIKYAKIEYTDIYGKVSNIKVAVKRFDENEILAYAKFKNNLEIKTPQEVTFSIVCSDGLYKAQARINKIDNDEPYTFFYLSEIQNLQHEQKREYFRVDMDCDCVYTIHNNDISKEFHTKTANISANGVNLILPENIISETPSDLEITVDGKRIHTKLKYIRSEKINNGYEISFKYINLSESDRDYISRVCLKKQLEERRNNLK